MHAHTTHTRGLLYVKKWHSDCYYKCVDVDSNCLAKNDSLTTPLSSTSIIFSLPSERLESVDGLNLYMLVYHNSSLCSWRQAK